MYWDMGLDVADASGSNNYFDRHSLLRAANRYVSSTSFPVTASPFGLSRVGASVPAAGGAVDVEIQMEEEALGWVVADSPEWISGFRRFRHRPDHGHPDGVGKQICRRTVRNGGVPRFRQAGMRRHRHAGRG